ncbi:MAG TPA: hypothetical protein ENK43_16105 [Planctomycetes bacterium]|nr:hypothetical protein [Planctomycetota bacterium]
MDESVRISKVVVWLPAAFCAALSIMKMILPRGSGDPAFYSFLPICFFLVAVIQHSLWKRVTTLETALRDSSAPAGKTRGGDASSKPSPNVNES